MLQTKPQRRKQPTARARAALLRPSAPELEPEELSWLSTGENRIVDENGTFVNLRGVCMLGLDMVASMTDQDVRQSLALDDRNLTVLTDTWGINVVRLPFRAETFLPGAGVVSLDDRLAQLDAVIDAVAQAGAYALLALQAPTLDGITPLPTEAAFQCWPLLADRYQDESAVLYELYAATAPQADGWPEAAGRLVGAIRREHPASLILVGSGTADSRVEGLPLRFATGAPVHNIVYTIRVQPPVAPIRDGNALTAFARTYSVLASQWVDGSLDLGRSAEGAALLFERLAVGWTAGFWNADPRLVANAAVHNFTATRFGLVVRRTLTLPAPLQLAPFTRD
jgi:hypothetical protein